MTSLLRHSSHITRLSSSSIRTASRCQLIHRAFPIRSSLPRPWLCSRLYSDFQPGDPKPTKNTDVQNTNKARDGEKIVEEKQNSTKKSAQNGSDGSESNMSRLSEDDARIATSKLTPEEEKTLDGLLQNLKLGMPTTQANELERAFKCIKEEGIPTEVREVMERLKAGAPMDLATAAKLVRMTTTMARKAAQRNGEEPAPIEDEPQQKSGAHDPGPQSRESKKGERPSVLPKNIGEIKIDMGTFIMTAFVTYLLYRLISPGELSKEITWQEFRAMFLDKGLVEKVVVLNQHRARVHLHRDAVMAMYPDSPAVNPSFHYYFSIGSVDAFERRIDEAQADLDIPNSERIPVAYTDEVHWLGTFLSFGPTLLLIGSVFWLSRRAASGAGGQSGIFGMGRSRAKRFNHETDVQVKFSDVAGMDEAKQEIMEFVSFLKEPGIYQKLGAKIPRGAILSGPPGTGKTLLAKATAGESQVPFFSVSGSEFVEMFVGVGASRVRDLFANARKNTPCIIFIDEIDAIGKSRAKQNFGE